MVGVILPSLLIAPAWAETRVALVIGNSVYQHAPHLTISAKDANLVAGALRQDGFAVTLANDLDYDNFFRTLKHFRTDAEGADWAVIYFAGHSISADGINYLIPTDANIAKDGDLPWEAVPTDKLIDVISGARSLRVVIIDACRRNPFLPGMITHVRMPDMGCARPPELQTGTVVVNSASEGATVEDGQGADGPFASALARQLTRPGLELMTMLRLVREDVLRATDDGQAPFVYANLPRREFFFQPAGR